MAGRRCVYGGTTAEEEHSALEAFRTSDAPWRPRAHPDRRSALSFRCPCPDLPGMEWSDDGETLMPPTVLPDGQASGRWLRLLVRRELVGPAAAGAEQDHVVPSVAVDDIVSALAADDVRAGSASA